MLLGCRTAGEGCARPTCAVVPSEVEGFLEALWELQSACHDCFTRREPRAPFLRSYGLRGPPGARLAEQVADSFYGKSPDVLDAIAACVGVTALVVLPAATRCWSQRPHMTGQTSSSR
jgi:hypothetical protein